MSIHEHIREVAARAAEETKQSAGFFQRRMQGMLAEQHPMDASGDDEDDESGPNMGTWSPAPVSGIAQGPAAFTFRDRDASLRRANYEDPTLLAGFSGKEADQENYVGHQLIRRYKEAPSPEGMEHLMSHYDQLIGTAVSRVARQRLPEPAVRGRVYNAFADAVDGYDFRETDGRAPMQFHNFFNNYVFKGKVKHWADSNRGFAHVPFERAAKHDRVRVAVDQFSLDQEREPTIPELQQMTDGISAAELRRILPELKSTGLASKNLRSDFVVDESEMWKRAVVRTRDSFPAKSVDQRVYEDWYGMWLGGDDWTGSKSQLAQKHGISSSKLSKMFTRWRSLHDQEMSLIRETS